MKITDKERDAIRNYIEDTGGYRRFAITLNISEPTAYRIGKGHSKIIQGAIWQRLAPLIQPYLDKQVTITGDNRNLSKESSQENPFIPLIVKELKTFNDEQLKRIYKVCLEISFGNSNS